MIRQNACFKGASMKAAYKPREPFGDCSRSGSPCADFFDKRVARFVGAAAGAAAVAAEVVQPDRHIRSWQTWSEAQW
jgi:hypothetical protein